MRHHNSRVRQAVDIQEVERKPPTTKGTRDSNSKELPYFNIQIESYRVERLPNRHRAKMTLENLADPLSFY